MHLPACNYLRFHENIAYIGLLSACGKGCRLAVVGELVGFSRRALFQQISEPERGGRVLGDKDDFSTPCALRVPMPLSFPVSTAKSASTVMVSTPSFCSAV